jgi:nucleotide-binding universal stress UspA family protein
MTQAASGPVLFGYDGSDLAGEAISEAGWQLWAGRDALVLTIWRPFGVEFLPVGKTSFDAADAVGVKKAAEETAAHGASLAGDAGFLARSITAEATPTWKGIIEVADEHDASLIVLGFRGRSGLHGTVLGSVAHGVGTHSRRSVLVVHPPAVRER